MSDNTEQTADEHVNMPIYKTLIEKLDDIGVFLQQRNTDRDKAKNKEISYLMERVASISLYQAALVVAIICIIALAAFLVKTNHRLDQSEEIAKLEAPRIHMDEPISREKETYKRMNELIRQYSTISTAETNTRLDAIVNKLDALISKKIQPKPSKIKPKPAAVAHKKPIKNRHSRPKAYKAAEEITDYETYINEVVKSPDEKRREMNPNPYPIVPQPPSAPDGYKPIGDHNKAYWNPVTGNVIGPKP